MNNTRVLLALGLLCTSAAFAETDLTGDWRGKLAVDATTSLPVQFTFTKKPDGSFSAVLNSPESESIRNVPASAVSLKDGALKVDVPSLTGSYSGTLEDDRFEGQWSQTGSKPIALVLSRPPQLTKADLEMLTGRWHGQLAGPRKRTMIFEFKPDSEGVLVGHFSVPEEGLGGLSMVNLQIEPGTMSFKAPNIGGEYKGTYSARGITGTLTQGGSVTPINLTKGDAAEKFYPLKLSAEQFSALFGDWKGKIRQLDCVLRFRVGPGNSFAAFLELDSKLTIPVAEASGTGKKVVLKIESPQAEFSGEIAGKTLTGQWVQSGQSTPVTWTKQ